MPDEQQTSKLEQREQRQNAEQQHGDTFTVDDTDEPTDTSGVPTDASTKTAAESDPDEE